MTTITIEISDEQARQLERSASFSSTTLGGYVWHLAQAELERRHAAFEKEAAYVLEKNVELYQRLAKGSGT